MTMVKFANLNTLISHLKRKSVIFGLSAAACSYYCYANEFDIRHFGAVRISRAIITAGRIVVDYKRSLRNLDSTSEQYRSAMSQVHERSAKKLFNLCCKNGGCYVKVGQHLGALDYLLPKEYTETLKILHSDAPQSPLNDVKRVIREDLEQDVNDLFTSFEDEPLGAASLAQVHKAVLKDGRTVAVKVQHRHVKSRAAVDIATMELLVKIVAKLFPSFQLLWLAEESKKNLPMELDFVNEGRNCERLSRMCSDVSYLKVPEIYWDYTATRVLTMEFCEGGQVNDLDYMEDRGINVNEVTSKLGELYSKMIFVEGFVHCDPHPGNVLVNNNQGEVQVVLLDHGLYQTLNNDFRMKYCNLWSSIIERNVEGIRHHALALGTGELFPLFACMVTGRSWESVSNTGIVEKEFSQSEGDEIKKGVAQYLPQISDVLNRVPRQMLLLFKTNDLLRGIETSLDTRSNANSFLTMSKTCVHAQYEKKRREVRSRVRRLALLIVEYWKIFKIKLYELYLKVTGAPLRVSKHMRSWGKKTVKKKHKKIKKKIHQKIQNRKDRHEPVLRAV